MAATSAPGKAESQGQRQGPRGGQGLGPRQSPSLWKRALKTVKKYLSLRRARDMYIRGMNKLAQASYSGGVSGPMMSFMETPESFGFRPRHDADIEAAMRIRAASVRDYATPQKRDAGVGLLGLRKSRTVPHVSPAISRIDEEKSCHFNDEPLPPISARA